MASNLVLHKQRAKAAWPILVRRARTGARPITYGDLCAQMGGGVHPRAASYFLGVIQSHCAKTPKGAKLQALAVNKATGVPGGGFHGMTGAVGYAKELAKVKSWNWSLKAPKF